MYSFIDKIMENQLNSHKRNCPANITDLVFLEIEKNYMRKYQILVSQKGKVNGVIGKRIKTNWNLKNIGRCNHPKSILIKSYEEHSNRLK